jgi:glycosyltransferase involved in cell wall biosynthesis
MAKKKVVVVLPAYNAELTLKQTFDEIPFDVVDDVILVDDASTDKTVELAKTLGIKTVIRHNKNLGYGGNQKTCYTTALNLNADIIVMLHPDYQYPPKLIKAMVSLIEEELYSVVIGSRILGTGALKRGMPFYKYFSNRLLTFAQNLLMSQKLSEYHTGYRAYNAAVLKNIPYQKNSDDFVFDNQLLSQILFLNYDVAEVTCPARYFKEASSINFFRSVTYGTGVLMTALRYFLAKNKIYTSNVFKIN